MTIKEQLIKKMEEEERKERIKDEFLFNLDGLIKGNYIRVQTDSKEAIIEIIKIMDEETNE